VVIGNLRAWADAVAALPVESRLPVRTVLVPNEAHAHALRCELIARVPGALAGTRFLTSAAAARTVLEAGGVAYQLGEELRRPLRLRAWLRGAPVLGSYRAEELRTPGWEEAFASTIEQLELASLRPEDLERLDTPRATDLATIWRALDEDAGDSWSIPRLVREACQLLSANPAVWPYRGAVLAAVPFGITAVDAALLRAIPSLTIGSLFGRPVHRGVIDRMQALLGGPVATALAAPMPPAARTDELGVLQQYLLEPPGRLAGAERRRSRGPDGTVTLEAHAGIDEELDAAARWVAEEVFHHGTPLQDIAILLPSPDPIAALVADRLAALPWPIESSPVYLASGRPAVSTACGARLLAVVQALVNGLPASAMVELLPRLRLEGDDGHLSPGRARAVVDALGTIGGSAARPQDALQWRGRCAAATLPSARAVAPAVVALVAIAAEMNAGAKLAVLWASFRAFVAAHVIAPRAMGTLIDQLDAAVRALAADRVTVDVVGVVAMQLIADELVAMRLRSGRFGEPAIYVGTILEAVSLPFRAVRILGIAEGMFPRTLRDDALLPSDLRRELPPHSISSDEDFAALQLHAFDQVVRGVRERLVISAPRTDLDGSEREPAALFIEIAAALARPDAAGQRARVIPNRNDLERDAFRPARSSVSARRTDTPLTAACWLDRVASGEGAGPGSWSRSAILDPAAIAARRVTMHGDLGTTPLTQRVPGLEPTLPMSASKLQDLLTCPHRFLLAHILRFRARSTVAENHRIDALAYGALVHRLAERFWRTHGAAFGAREHSVVHWRQVAAELADGEFDELLTRYPLVGHGVIAAERRRLHRDIATLIDHDWDGGRPRAFVDVERSFGLDDEPLSVPTEHGPLFVTGRIDRLDVDQGIALVRDFKTGKAHPRERDEVDAQVQLDLQLAVYSVVAEQLAVPWGIPTDVAAMYVYVDRFAIHRERSFRADRGVLRALGRHWLELALGLIRAGGYVQTTDPETCKRCRFAPICIDDLRDRRTRLRDATGPVAAYRELTS